MEARLTRKPTRAELGRGPVACLLHSAVRSGIIKMHGDTRPALPVYVMLSALELQGFTFLGGWRIGFLEKIQKLF